MLAPRRQIDAETQIRKLINNLGNHFPLGKPQKKYLFSGQSTKAFSPPPPRLSKQTNFCFVLKLPETDFEKKFLHNFWTKRAIFLGKRNLLKTEFFHRQLIH